MRLLTLLTLSTAAAALPGTAAAAEDNATYHVKFERTWSAETHPKDFPLLAHFSPVIGATHDSGYQLFADGAIASTGIEKLCEEGKHQPLDQELRDAMRGGHVGALIETGDPIRDVPGRAEADFQIDAKHPLVSLAAMIAPSPDWCAVAADVNLRPDGRFVAEKSVDLYAWDAGTDSATRYRALDSDSQPREAERLAGPPYFEKQGKRVPVGRVTFVRK